VSFWPVYVWFNSRWILLRRWALNDPTLDRTLPTIPEDAEGKYAQAFCDHVNRCVKCNER
jgi:hypothetical protein